MSSKQAIYNDVNLVETRTVHFAIGFARPKSSSPFERINKLDHWFASEISRDIVLIPRVLIPIVSKPKAPTNRDGGYCE